MLGFEGDVFSSLTKTTVAPLHSFLWGYPIFPTTCNLLLSSHLFFINGSQSYLFPIIANFVRTPQGRGSKVCQEPVRLWGLRGRERGDAAGLLRGSPDG